MVDLIVTAFADMIAHALEGFVSLIMPIFSFSFTMFDKVFPYAGDAYVVLQRLALGICLLIATVQIIPMLFQSKRSTTTPTRVLVFLTLSVACIYYGNYVLEWIMDIAQLPYYALMKMYAADNSISDTLSGISFMPISAALDVATAGLASGPSVLLYIVLLIMVGIAFIKVLLEAVERYVMLFVLVYLSPLFSATLASDTTSGVFKKYFLMFLSQCLLLILNIWFLEMSISCFANLGSTSPMIALVMGYALLRIAGRMDSYLNQLGMNSAVTGIGLGNELMATGMMIAGKFSNAASGGSFGGGRFGFGGNGNGPVPAGNGGGGGAGGFAQRFADTVNRYDPTGPVKDGVKGVYSTVGNAFGAGVSAAGEAEGGYLDKLRAGFGTGFSTVQSGFGENMEAARKEGAKSNLWSRDLYNDGEAHPGMNIIGNDTLTPEDLNDIATSPYLGDDIMENLTDGAMLDDPSAVAATMQSIGLDQQFQEGQEAVAVGYGNTAADDIAFTAGENGIHGKYEKDGRVHDFDIKTASQYNALSPQEQQAYTGFKNREGTQYYYKHDSWRADTPYQKQQAAAQAAFASTLANPTGTLHTPESLAYMKKTPGALGQYINSFADGDIPQAQAMDTWKSIQPEGAIRAGYNQGLDMLARGNATMTREDGVTNLSWNDTASGGTHSFSVSTSPIGDSSVPMKQSDGSILYGSYQAPPTQTQKILSSAKTFGSDFGSDRQLSSLDWAAAQNLRPSEKNQLMTDVYDSYLQTNPNASLPDTQEVRDMVANRLDALDYRSLGLNQRDVGEFSSKLRSGEATVLHESARGTQVEFHEGNRFKTFTLVTNHAMENEPSGPDTDKFTPETLGNRGFSIRNMGKGNFYAAHVEEMPENATRRMVKRISLGKSNPQR